MTESVSTSGLDIARAAEMKPIEQVAADLGRRATIDAERHLAEQGIE